MKIYVSADIEGIAGIASWDEANPAHADYAEFRERMTDHVAAACEGAVAAGALEILVRDAHATARNVRAVRLPRCARLVRGWSGHPLSMVQELDESFDAALMVGYHSKATSGGNPLAHTLSSSKVARLAINGRAVSEFHLNAWAAESLGVPVVFVSGDEVLCEEVAEENPHIRTCPVMRGAGASTVSLHPEVARERIREGAEAALRGDLAACRLGLAERFRLEIRYKEATRAHRQGFYPGAEMVDDLTVAFETGEYFEVLRALQFLV
ncbi:MAG: M55 family metallopeptidase [Planctomycetota bacterium]